MYRDFMHSPPTRAQELAQKLQKLNDKYIVEGIRKTFVHARDMKQMTALHEKMILDNIMFVYNSISHTFFSAEMVSTVEAVRGDAGVCDALDVVYNNAFSAFMEHYSDLQPLSPMHTPHGNFSHNELFMVCLSALDSARTTVMDSNRRAALSLYSAVHFSAARKLALVFVADTPIKDYSMYELVKSLFAIYQATGAGMGYDPVVEKYCQMLLWRARQFVSRPAHALVHDVVELRVATEESGALFRASHRYIRDITILHHALIGWFDAALLLPSAGAHNPAHADRVAISSAVQWLRLNSSKYLNSVVQNMLIHHSLCAGEYELFLADSAAKETTDHEVIQRHRLPEFLILMEQALLTPGQIVYTRVPAHIVNNDTLVDFVLDMRPDIHFTLAVAATLAAEITSANPAVKARDYVIFDCDFTPDIAAQLRCVPRINEPVLVMCCNRLNLCYKGKMQFCSNAVVAVVQWAKLVHDELDDKLCNKVLNVEQVLDHCLYAFETDTERLNRKQRKNSAPAREGDFLGTF